MHSQGDGFDANGNYIGEGVDPTTLIKEQQEKLLDSFEAEYNDKAKKILNEEAKDKAKVVAKDLEIKNKAQEQLIKKFRSSNRRHGKINKRIKRKFVI